MPQRVSDLIYDIGTSEGNDTAYYLSKGFRVVSVEADPKTFAAMENRFGADVDANRVVPLHRAVHSRSDEEIEFWSNGSAQGLSSLHRSVKTKFASAQVRCIVRTVNYPALINEYGIPHYCKIDVEGGEAEFLKSVDSLAVAPQFISTEMHSIDPVTELKRIGYKQFKLVDQRLVYKFDIPNPPREGIYVPNPNFKHASGPFGRELPGPWVDFDHICKMFEMIQVLRQHKSALWSWYDCHAWNPDV